ncbi:MAG TPA: M23 family metallopeptidase [Solirubrobacteraceae bacterium]
MPKLALVLLLLALPTPAPAGAARWRWPVFPHRVAAPFHFDPGAPFVRGARRGMRLAGAPGAAVGSACAGRVRFAGALPGSGLTVAVRCGPLVATHLGLGALAVGAGARVRAGQALGRLSATGAMRLGARVARRSRGYLDPARLLAAGGGPDAPLGPAPPGPVPRAPRPLRAPRPTPAARAIPRGGLSPAALGAAWLGLGLLGVAVGAGMTLRSRSRATTSVQRGCPDRPSTSPRRSTT